MLAAYPIHSPTPETVIHTLVNTGAHVLPVILVGALLLAVSVTFLYLGRKVSR